MTDNVLSRRDLLAAGAALSAVALANPASSAESDLPVPALAFAFQAEVLLGTVQELGVIDGMRRRIVPIIGGTVSGERLTGEVLSGGADWQSVRPSDGLTRVFARYWLKADDGAVIGVENAGIRKAPASVMKRLLAGEVVAPAEYYFRTTPSFDVGDGPHRWLNETMFICVGARKPDKAIIRFYAVS